MARIFCLFRLVIVPTRFFMLSHTAFSDENVQHKIRELIFIYAMIYWILRSLRTWQIITALVRLYFKKWWASVRCIPGELRCTRVEYSLGPSR